MAGGVGACRVIEQAWIRIRSQIGQQPRHAVGSDFDSGALCIDENGIAENGMRQTDSCIAAEHQNPGLSFCLQHPA